MAQEVMEVNQAMDAHEGCNIFGWLDLQRVAGNFRVSVHVEDFFALTRVWHKKYISTCNLFLHVAMPGALPVLYLRMQLSWECMWWCRLRSPSLRLCRRSWHTWRVECEPSRCRAPACFERLQSVFLEILACAHAPPTADVGLSSVQLQADTTGINSSHIIHKVSFGPTFPGQVNPLDGAICTLEPASLFHTGICKLRSQTCNQI